MTDEEEILVGRRLPRVMHVKGCPKCSNTGYRGRIAIHEVLPINKQIREMVTGGATTEQLKDYAVEVLGMRTLKQEAISLVEQGITTVEELSRVSYYE